MYIYQILVQDSVSFQDCSVLPSSANPGFEQGCKGAVYSGGNPSEDYCRNVGEANNRFPWYQACCKWENGECTSKGSDEIELKILF